MDCDMRTYVCQLLKSFRGHEQKIRLLRYELLHYVNISDDEMIADRTFYKVRTISSSHKCFSDKTRYLLLNYRQFVDNHNMEAVNAITVELVNLEEQQNRLRYYVSLLSNQQAQIIRRVYFDGCAWDQIADEMGIVRRTAHKIKNRALENLVSMYEYAGTFGS